ncbi:MAG: N-acetylneuraminate synthase family protein [Treponema sp.]|nr:N-acetylneuraminate synthase family protein [Treponema sp.]
MILYRIPGKKSRGKALKKSFFCINGQTYSPAQVLLIAELGTSHGADPVKAGELIDAAAEAGADCIKFQIVYADEILHPLTGEVLLPGGKIRLYDRFKDLEVPLEFLADLKERVEKKGLIFLCTPFGPKSARDLSSLEPSCIKIASPELNYTALIREIAPLGLPVLLSTGVSRLSDIEEALDILKKAGPPPCLLHCVTAYPAPERDYNLRILQNLENIFGCPVGLSDHSLDPCLVPVLAAVMGASVIEKHFCLSRQDPGLDDPIALDPQDFALMVRAVRQAQAQGPKETLEALSKDRGRDLVEAILGDGVKRLAPSEEANYRRTNRSLHALGEIQEGDIITRDSFASLRTEKILRPGLPPSFEEQIIGRRARKTIPAGEGIRLEDI